MMPTATCPVCEHVVGTPGARFCGRCGSRLTRFSPVPDDPGREPPPGRHRRWMLLAVLLVLAGVAVAVALAANGDAPVPSQEGDVVVPGTPSVGETPSDRPTGRQEALIRPRGRDPAATAPALRPRALSCETWRGGEPAREPCLRWLVELPSSEGPPRLVGSNSSSVYVTEGPGRILSVDRLTGRLQWRVGLGGGDLAALEAGDDLIAAVRDDGTVLVLDTGNGARHAVVETGGGPGDAGIPAVGVGAERAFVAERTMVRAVGPIEHGQLWSRRLPNLGGALLGEGLVVVSRGATVIRLDPETGRTRWSSTVAAPVEAGARPVGGLLLVSDVEGRVHALDPVTGDVRWTTRVRAGSGTTTVAGSAMSIITVTGVVTTPESRDRVVATAFALDPSTGEVAWRSPLEGPGFAHPSVALTPGRAVFGHRAHASQPVVALDLEDESVAWRQNLGAGSAEVEFAGGGRVRAIGGVGVHDLAASDGSPVARYRLGDPHGRALSGPGASVYVQTQDMLLAIEPPG